MPTIAACSTLFMKATHFASLEHGTVVHLTRAEADRLVKHWTPFP